MNALKSNVRCPICGKNTFRMQNDMEVCPVCGWINGNVQTERYTAHVNNDPVVAEANRPKYNPLNKEEDI